MSVAKKSASKSPVAMVTGAGRGIGRAIVIELARRGFDAAGLDILCDPANRKEGLFEVKAGVERLGRRFLPVACDVAAVAGHDKAVESVFEAFGRVDVLVNNAGVYPMQSFLEMEYSQWREIFEINTDSIFHLCRAFVPGMVERRRGRVINVTSTSVAAGMANYTHYNASKAAIIGFTRSLAAEVGPFEVTVNALAPGLVRTPTTDSGPQADGMFEGFLAEQCIKRTEEPKDLAGTVSWLASEDASFVTGQTIHVDGGWMFT